MGGVLEGAGLCEKARGCVWPKKGCAWVAKKRLRVAKKRLCVAKRGSATGASPPCRRSQAVTRRRRLGAVETTVESSSFPSHLRKGRRHTRHTKGNDKEGTAPLEGSTAEDSTLSSPFLFLRFSSAACLRLCRRINVHSGAPQGRKAVGRTEHSHSRCASRCRRPRLLPLYLCLPDAVEHCPGADDLPRLLQPLAELDANLDGAAAFRRRVVASLAGKGAGGVRRTATERIISFPRPTAHTLRAE